MAIRQHLQTTDSDNFDVHVQKYIIQEHNDDQISSDGTVAWERNIRHLHHIAALLTTCPPTKRCLKRNLLIILALLHRSWFFAQPAIYVFTQNMLHKLPPVNWSAAANTTPASLHAQKCTHRHHQASTQGLLNTCVSLCVGSDMLSPRIMHALRLRRLKERHTPVFLVYGCCIQS